MNAHKHRLFTLFCIGLFTAWLWPAIAAEPACPVDGAYVTYEDDSGQLHIPAIEILDADGRSQGIVRVEMQLAEETAEGSWFTVTGATPANVPAGEVRARYDGATKSAELNGYILGARGNIRSFNRAIFSLDPASGRFLVSELVENPFSGSGINAPVYAGTESVFSLVRGGADQFLLPVEVGNQTLNLLVDTGSDALLVFEDRLSDCNRNIRKREDNPIQVSDTPVSKSYASGTREGVLATAPVRIGAYSHPAMQIMLIRSPDSQSDPSLTAKGADGIIGLRRTAGLNFGDDAALLDAPLNLLSPLVSGIEFNLPPAGEATLSFGKQPLLERIDPALLFRAKALNVADPNDRTLRKRFADMQMPFRAKTSYGEADDEDLDILFDTGAVSRLVLDTQVAEKLGYNAAKGEWMIDEDEEIELNLIGLNETATLYPKFKVWEVSVAPYRTMGVEFEAVLGISRWQEYVVGFDFVPDYNGGPDGTISLLRRTDLDALGDTPVLSTDDFMPLPGLNSAGNDEYPSTDNSGNLVAFQSDRNNGLDVYLWQRGSGLRPLPGLNSAANETRPHLSADGRFIAFESDRNGIAPIGADIYLYDVNQQTLVDLPGLNSDAEDSMPVLNADGRFIAFVSQRNGNPDVFLYDREQNGFVDLAGVNSAQAESAPALTADGRYLGFTQTVNGNEDIRVYDVQGQTLLPLSSGMQGINTGFDEQRPALHLGTLRLAFHSNRKNPELGLYNRDVFVVDMLTQIPLAQSGLNSDSDDIAARFSGDGSLLAFQSRRAGGVGGADVYLYKMTPDAAPAAGSVAQEIAFARTDAGLFTAPVDVGGQNLNLLVDTHFNALLLFRDRAAGLADSGLRVNLELGTGRVDGTLADAQITLGRHQAAMRVVLADRAAAEAALGMSTGTADGILGLSMKAQLPPGPPPADAPADGPPSGGLPPMADVPLIALQPPVNLLEMNFGAHPGLTLNRLPVTGGNDRAHYTGMQGTRIPGQPGAYTDLRVPFTALGYGADDFLPVSAFGIPQSPTVQSQDLPRAALSTLLTDRVMLHSAAAQALGYDGQSWGGVERLDLSFLLIGSDALLPLADSIPVNKVQVTDFSAQDYVAVLGTAYWNRYTLGIDYMSNGSAAMLFLADDRSDLQNPADLDSDHFVPLPGLNSIADEESGAISADGNTIAFHSNRRNGDYDVYVWRSTLLDLPGLNSARADKNPSLDGAGSLLAFESERNGAPDIFLYDLDTGSFIDLPGLNTAAPEQQPVLNADGTQLAYMTRRDGVHNGSADVYLYDLATKKSERVYSGWLNTRGDESEPALSGDLLAFTGLDRADSRGRSDVYLYNLRRGLVEVPALRSRFTDAGPVLSADGNFLAFFSDRYGPPSRGHLGADIFLTDLVSGELLDLPGLNSAYEDIGPALTPNAEFILFHSKRPGGEGGYDLYLYRRDLEDTTRYSVSVAYVEDGYVTGADGRPLAGVTVQAHDGDGILLGSAVTDSAGNFILDIPAGALLPLTYSTDSGTVVIDKVGDDTYVPDFEAGNLKFTEVWVEDTLQAGMPSKIWFDVATETPKYNTFVKIYLVKLPTGSVDDLDVTDFTPDYTLTALSIDALGQTGPGEAVTHTQGQDIVTEITYLSDDNRQAHVEHSFIVPASVADGTYAAVFSIGRFDYHPEDDALQSEDAGDKKDNFLAAPASVIVGQPTLPNLRILSAELHSNSFELPAQRPTEKNTPFGSELTLNLEVESMAQDTELPVDIVFSMDIDGQSYPLSFADHQSRRPSKLGVKTYPVTCREETRDGYPAGERCASLFRQEQQGYTYKLYIDAAAYDALATKAADTTVNLVIQIDPAATVTEWENNTADNVKVMPVMFLAPRTDSARRMTRSLGVTVEDTGADGWPEVTDYGTDFFTPISEAEVYGNDDFGVGYAFNAALTYAEGSVTKDDGDVVNYPYAAALDATDNEVYVNVFGNQVDVLTVDVAADLNGDKIICSWFGYDVNVIGTSATSYAKTWQAYVHVEGIDPKDNDTGGSCAYGNRSETTQEVELWSSQDEDGNELYTVSKSKDYEKTFTIGGVPITVAAGATGDLGIRGDVTIDTTNTLDVEVGPYLELTGYAEGGVGVTGFNAGIGIELLILGVDLPFHATLQVLPSYPLAIFNFEAPLIISTLDGKLYLYLKTVWDKYTYTILKWNGLEWEWALIDPVYLVWAEADQFVLANSGGILPGEFASSGDDLAVSALDYDWGEEGAFNLTWQGDFTFDAATYTFSVDADDNVTLKMDSDGDNDYETTLLALDDGQAIDLAGYDDSGDLNGATSAASDALSGVESSGAMSFDGSTDYIELSTNPIPTDVGTIEHWVKPSGLTDVLVYTGDNSGGADYDGFGHGGSSSVEIHTGIDGDGKAYFAFEQDGSDTVYKLRSSAPLFLGTWHHIAATYDYQGELKLYVDGVEVDSDTIPATKYDLRSPGNYDGFKSYIGRPIKSTRYFLGSLDEVRIWNYIRDEQEINGSMDSQLSGDEDGLVAYYRFDATDYSGTTTNDVEITEDVLALEVDYENLSGQADISVSWSKTNTFTVSYYDSADWSGDAAATGLETEIDHDWGAGAPGDNASGNAYGINEDAGTDFSAVWEGTFEFAELTAAQDYVFMLTTDDDSPQFYVDDSLQTLTAITGTDMSYAVVNLSATSHTIKLQYSHSGGDAMMKLDWQPAGTWLLEEYLASTGTIELTSGTYTYYNDYQLIDSQLVAAADFDFSGVYTNDLIAAYQAFTNSNIDLLSYYKGFFYFDTAGDYDFISRIDDGMKLYVDGKAYLGQFDIDEAAGYIVPVTLSAGYHLIEVEHYDEIVEGSYAVRELDWTLRNSNAFIGFYYSTQTDMDADDPWDADSYDGTEPLLISKDASDITGCSFTTTSLICDWGASSPVANLTGVDSAYLTTDNFGVRWIGDFDFDEGVYVFTAKADDSLKLWVDDVELLETGVAGATVQEAVVMLSDSDTGDSHNLRIEYWEDTGDADVELSWSEISQDTFNVQYFTTTDLTGTPTDGGTVSSIDYSSGSDSARWVGVFEFQETDYTFTVNTDGGVRVYVDGDAIIDEWTAQSTSTEYTATVALEEGLHSVKVEYFEGNSGSPAIDVTWLGSSEIAGNALALDGSGDYVKADVEDWSGSFTVESWVKASSQSAYTSLFSSTDSGAASSFQIDFDSSGNLQLRGAKASSGNFTVTIGAVTGEWQHIAVTFDGETISTYLDGELQNTSSQSFDGLFTVYKVGLNRTGGLPFAGEVDEFRVWTTARSQAEIQAWMKSTLRGDESHLSAYYQFDQSSGTTATDTTGNYDATFYGDPQWVTSDALLTEMAPPGSALSFDGSDDYVDLNAGIIDLTTADFTIETWIKTTGSGDDILVKNDSDSSYEAGEKRLVVDGDGILFFAGYGNGRIFGSTAINDGSWHHVAVVWDYDETTDSGTGTLYLDGEDDTDFTSYSLYTPTNEDRSDDTLKIGASVGSNFFQGDLDEVRLWNVARSSAEIQAYMNRTLDGDESGLVAYYNFDEVSGSTQTTLTDVAGSNDGVLNGDPAWVDSGATLSKVVAPGNAMSFDGAGDYVEVSGYQGITGTDSRTVEAWIKTTADNADIASWGTNATGEKWIFRVQNTNGTAGTIRVEVNGGYVVGSTVVNDGEWHHVAATFEDDGSPDVTDVKLYVDGTLESTSATNTQSLDTAAGNNVQIGNGHSNRYFNGEIDEVRIWDVARSEAEIQADMYTTVGSFETGLVAYYRFDQDSGTEVVDVSSFDHDGTLNGGPTWVTSTVPVD